MPLLLLAALPATAWQLGWQNQVSWAALATHRLALHAIVQTHPLASVAAYLGIYAAAVGVSLPGTVVLTLAGGLLFGTALGAVLAVVGATAGAALLFLVARSVLADLLTASAGSLLARLRPGLQRDGFRYLLALRLLPLFPFWLVNLVPALVDIRFLPYIAATFIGIIPATTVFASVGAGLDRVLAAGGQPDLSVLFSAPVLLPLICLAALSVAPVAWRFAVRR